MLLTQMGTDGTDGTQTGGEDWTGVMYDKE